MIKRLISHGNSSALIIDKPILDLLKMDENTPLEIATDGKNLIISPLRDEAIDESGFLEALERVNNLHGRTLKKLAE